MLGQLFKQIPDIIQMDSNVDGKYEDTKRTRWFKLYLERRVESERSGELWQCGAMDKNACVFVGRQWCVKQQVRTRELLSA